MKLQGLNTAFPSVRQTTHRLLIAVEQSRVFNRAVVMHLPPTTLIFHKNAADSYSEFDLYTVIPETTAPVMGVATIAVM
jgi:hypothetical protein